MVLKAVNGMIRKKLGMTAASAGGDEEHELDEVTCNNLEASCTLPISSDLYFFGTGRFARHTICERGDGRRTRRRRR